METNEFRNYTNTNISESEETPPSKAEHKARIFYKSCLDKNNTMQKRGAKPLLEHMKVTIHHSSLSIREYPRSNASSLCINELVSFSRK